MHVTKLLQQRFEASLSSLVQSPEDFSSMIRPTTDPKHGDYQANFAMPLAKQLGKPPREVAAEVIAGTKLDDLCQTPQIAGPGFINLKLTDAFLTGQLQLALDQPRCGVAKIESDQRIVIDFSSPNVAKPMHVGHIRSTVIGDALARTLKFLGYRTITDNHLGDWGTQFGIIIYGYKHFGDAAVVDADPVPELAKLYRHVNGLIEYRKGLAKRPKLQQAIVAATNDQSEQADALERQQQADTPKDPKAEKKLKKSLASATRRLETLQREMQSLRKKIASVENDPKLSRDAAAHPDIDQAVLRETAKLHQGDTENLSLWEKFLPFCKDEINRVYDRLGVEFDYTLGESFYHAMLGDVVAQLKEKGLASTSDGAVCVFLDAFEAPMIVQKRDGAFLYATTDLATLGYRRDEFQPSEILYVVDSRQSEHFDKLFAVASQFGMRDIKLVHVNFGTVLSEDGKPMKTRSGSLIGLEGLLDDAVQRAKAVVCDPVRLENFDPPMQPAEQQTVAETVGIGAIKFADLGHHRTSDYRFNLDKMVALEGNTSAYVQYSYARTQAILARAGLSGTDVVAMAKQHGLMFHHPAERSLALSLLRLEETLLAVHKEYAPNILVDYLLETARDYSRFNDNCPVLKAETDAIRVTRLALVTMTGRVLQLGLSLLGVGVVPRM